MTARSGLTCPGQDVRHAPRHEQNAADQTHLRQQHLPPLAHFEHLGDDGFLGDRRHGAVLMLMLLLTRGGHRRGFNERQNARCAAGERESTIRGLDPDTASAEPQPSPSQISALIRFLPAALQQRWKR